MNSRGFSKIEILITDDGVNVETKETRREIWIDVFITGELQVCYFVSDSLNNHALNMLWLNFRLYFYIFFEWK
jgi:hypothetical protein